MKWHKPSINSKDIQILGNKTYEFLYFCQTVVYDIIIVRINKTVERKFIETVFEKLQMLFLCACSWKNTILFKLTVLFPFELTQKQHLKFL